MKLCELVVTRKCRHGWISFLKTDQVIGRSLDSYGEWAEKELALLTSCLREGDVVVDVGANIGTHTLAFAEAVGPTGCVHSIEPFPVNVELLKRNVEQNSLPNVVIHPCAVSNEEGTMSAPSVEVSDPDNYGGIRLASGCQQEMQRALNVEVNTVRLDQLIRGRVELIKIDVEGMEFRVLQGAPRILEESRPLVYAECNALDEAWPSVEFMRQRGYRTYLHYERAFNPDNFFQNTENWFGHCGEANLLFVPAAVGSEMVGTKGPANGGALVEIGDLDSLAAALLVKPQYREWLALRYGCSAMMTNREFREEIERIRGSWSMRVTAPLRRGARGVRTAIEGLRGIGRKRADAKGRR